MRIKGKVQEAISEAQEIFNKVITHLRKQGKPAAEGPYCRYRTEDGLKCAVGCLLPDEEYDSKYEGHIVGGLITILPESKTRDLFKRNVDLLDDLQCLHDNANRENFVADINDRAQRIAAEHGLKMP